MIYAQIKDGLVHNIIVLNNVDLIPIFSRDFDYLIRVDEMSPQPGILWLYDGETFSCPQQEEDDGQNGC